MATQANNPSSNAAGTGSKRRRIAVACNVCRTRKSRCDGRRPTCSTCSQLDFECEYDVPDSAANVVVRKDYVADLEQRLRKMERTLERHDDMLIGHLSACEPARNKSPENVASSRAPDDREQSYGPIRLEASVLEAPDGEGDADARTDGMAITFVDEQAAVYFGETSNIRFVRYLLSAIASIWKIKKPEKPPVRDRGAVVEESGILTQQSGASIQPLSASSSSLLPAASEMEDMLGLYFNTIGLLFPFLHQPAFWEAYSDFKASGFSKVRKTWLGALNMMFAVASNTDRRRGRTSEESFQASLVFYTRAMALCGASSVRTVSLEIVQFLLLQVLYLQGTPRAVEAWNIHGLLVRAALAFGLHCEKAGRRLHGNEQEMRIRTWHTIYCVDKVLSVTFGRPSAIPEEYMTVRLPQPWQPAGSPRATSSELDAAQCTTEFLIVSIQLYQIMGESLACQYHGNIGSHEDADEMAMMQAAGAMRQKLRKWAAELPAMFSLLTANSSELGQSSKMSKLRTILTLRYHNVSILVHRPLLCATLQYLSKHAGLSDTELPYITQLSMAEAYECVASAEITIDIAAVVLAAGPAEDSNLGVWFFVLYYVFTASLMICGRMLWARHGHPQNADAVVASGRSSLTKAADALQNLDTTNPLVLRCVKYIRYLSQLQDGRSGPMSNELMNNQRQEGMEPVEDTSSNSHSNQPWDIVNMGDLVDDNFGLGPYLAAELFDASSFDAFMLPLPEENNT